MKTIYAIFPNGKVILSQREIQALAKLVDYKEEAKGKITITQLSKELNISYSSLRGSLQKLNGHVEFRSKNKVIYPRLFYLHQHIMPWRKISYPTWVVFS